MGSPSPPSAHGCFARIKIRYLVRVTFTARARRVSHSNGAPVTGFFKTGVTNDIILNLVYSAKGANKQHLGVM